MSNLKQLGTAFIMYCNDNGQCMPAPGSNANPRPEDWIYWQLSRLTFTPAQGPGTFGDGRIIKYLGKKSETIFRCPSDTNWPTRNNNGLIYRYSYVINNKMTCAAYGVTNVIGVPAKKLNNVRMSGQKILFYEEHDLSIDDGAGKIDGTVGSGSGPNTISVRHDRQRKFPDDQNIVPMPNLDRFGCVAFCDGHSDAIPRKLLHDTSISGSPGAKYIDPWWPGKPKP